MTFSNSVLVQKSIFLFSVIQLPTNFIGFSSQNPSTIARSKTKDNKHWTKRVYELLTWFFIMICHFCISTGAILLMKYLLNSLNCFRKTLTRLSKVAFLTWLSYQGNKNCWQPMIALTALIPFIYNFKLKYPPLPCP